MSFVITEPMVRKLLQTVDAGLTAGVGSPEPGKMCVEAAICYALGEPHGDGPSCVAPIVREAKIVLNDCLWSSEKARARGMRRVAIAQLGSKGMIDDTKFSTRVVEYTIREIVPLGLRSAALAHPSKTHRDSLEASAHNCRAASDAAMAARYAAMAAMAARAASDAARYAAMAARYAARAARAASDASDAASKSDSILCLSAELMVRALQECGSPGCEWLWLVDATACGAL